MTRKSKDSDSTVTWYGRVIKLQRLGSKFFDTVKRHTPIHRHLGEVNGDCQHWHQTENRGFDFDVWRKSLLSRSHLDEVDGKGQWRRGTKIPELDLDTRRRVFFTDKPSHWRFFVKVNDTLGRGTWRSTSVCDGRSLYHETISIRYPERVNDDRGQGTQPRLRHGL